MTISTEHWRTLVRALAEEFTAQGVLVDESWREAFTAVPRHVFVPGFYERVDPPRWIEDGDSGWLTGIYSDRTLPTQLLSPPGQEGSYVTSSSTRPGYMLWMLQLLEVADGMDVLEIGTGTGYTAALLTERLGDSHVSSVDIDPGLVASARQRLAEAGYRPVVEARDGTLGLAERAPYDRLIATVAVEDVPFAWVQQTRPGGIILADLRPPGMIKAGAFAKLAVSGDGTATGRLIDGGVGFMSARADAAGPALPCVPVIDKSAVGRRASDVGPDLLDRQGLGFAVWRRLPGLAVFPGRDRLLATTPDGCWAEVTRHRPSQVEYGGPADLWAVVEETATRWRNNGEPALEEYEITVTAERTRVRPARG